MKNKLNKIRNFSLSRSKQPSSSSAPSVSVDDSTSGGGENTPSQQGDDETFQSLSSGMNDEPLQPDTHDVPGTHGVPDTQGFPCPQGFPDTPDINCTAILGTIVEYAKYAPVIGHRWLDFVDSFIMPSVKKAGIFDDDTTIAPRRVKRIRKTGVSFDDGTTEVNPTPFLGIFGAKGKSGMTGKKKTGKKRTRKPPRRKSQKLSDVPDPM